MTSSRPPEEIELRQRRFRESIRMHEIEGNPLSAVDIAMHEKFEREGWSGEKRRAHIIAEAQRRDQAKRTPQG